MLFVQQQHHVVQMPIGLVGSDLGFGWRESWAVHGIGAWVVHGILGFLYFRPKKFFNS